MKCQLLISDGNRQVILYPEDEDERSVLKCLVSDKYDISTRMVETDICLCSGGYYKNFARDSGFNQGNQAVITLTRKKPTQDGNDG